MGNKKGVILLTYCNPASGNLPSLEDEFMKVDFVFDKQEVTGCYDIKNYPITKVDHLRDSINKFKNELVVFSYSGHAEPEELLLDNSAAHGVSLMEMLASCPNLKLVLLNGCSTAKLAQKGQALGIPVLIGTNRSVPDRDATSFAVSLFNSLRDKNTTIRSAFDYSKSASRLENNPGNNRAGRTEGELEDQIWNYFSTDDRLMDETLYRLCYVPAQVVFENEKAGVPKVFFIHTEAGQKSYDEIQERAPLENIAVGSISSTFINNNSETIDIDTVIKYWKAADAVCLLVNNLGFTTNFWPKICDQISDLQRTNAKSFLVSNMSIEAEYFDSFLKKIDSCEEYPRRESWTPIPNVERLNANNPGAGYSSLIKWLKTIISTPVKKVIFETQINKLNYGDQEHEYKNKKKDPSAHQFILIEGSPQCGHEWLYKRLLRNKTIDFLKTIPQSLDFAGQEIQSAEQLWQRLGDRVVGKTNRAEIVQEVTNRLQQENIVMVCDNVYSFSHNAEYLQKTRDILNQFWAEWTADFEQISTPNRLVLMVFNRGYNEETRSGKLDLLQKKQGNSDLIVLSPIGLLTKDILEDWHEDHNKVVFSPIAYQMLLEKNDDVLQDPHIKNVVHKICALYQHADIFDQLFKL